MAAIVPESIVPDGAVNARWDCLIVGAGPAGLTSAIYLARYRRKVLVMDAGDSRAALIPLTRNYPGFPDGVSGDELLMRLREQLSAYDVELRTGVVKSLSKPGSEFVAEIGHLTIYASTIILATGVADRYPQITDRRELTLDGRLRWCPICDGFDVSDKNVAVISTPLDALSHALFLRTYTRCLTLFVPAHAHKLGTADRRALAAAGIPLVETPIAKISGTVGQRAAIWLRDGNMHAFDAIYPMMGCDARSQLATGVGARVDNNGELSVSAHQCTSVPGLYAAGDVVKALNQMAVGVGHAAVAATAIHHYLPRNDR